MSGAGPLEMEISRRGEAVRIRVSGEGITPLVIIVSPAGTGPSLFEVGRLSFRYEGTSITPAQERLMRQVAGWLGDVTFDDLARRAPAEPEEPGVRDPGWGGISVTGWGSPDWWRTFIFRREFARNAGSAQRLSGRRVIVVSHGESECQFATPRIDTRTPSLYCYPWVRPLERVPRTSDLPDATVLPADITTDLRDPDIITGGTARLDAVLGDLAGWTRHDDVVVVRSTCVPHVIGDDMEASVRRWRGRGSIRFDDIFAENDGDLAAELLAEAISSGRRRRARGPSVSIAGLRRGAALDEISALLGEAGIEVRCALVPGIDLGAAPAWTTSSLQVLVPSPYHEGIYARVLKPLGMRTLEPAAPFGLEATRRWLAAVARAVGRQERMAGAWKAARRRHARALGRLREQAGAARLGFVIGAGEYGSLRDPVQMAGVPVLDVVLEMGFGVDVMVHAPDGVVPASDHEGVSVHPFEDRATLDALMRDLPSTAVYSDLYADERITSAGKTPFSLQLFEPGLEGALRTAERLVGACAAPFYRKYSRYVRQA